MLDAQKIEKKQKIEDSRREERFLPSLLSSPLALSLSSTLCLSYLPYYSLFSRVRGARQVWQCHVGRGKRGGERAAGRRQFAGCVVAIQTGWLECHLCRWVGLHYTVGATFLPPRLCPSTTTSLLSYCLLRCDDVAAATEPPACRHQLTTLSTSNSRSALSPFSPSLPAPVLPCPLPPPPPQKYDGGVAAGGRG